MDGAIRQGSAISLSLALLAAFYWHTTYRTQRVQQGLQLGGGGGAVGGERGIEDTNSSSGKEPKDTEELDLGSLLRTVLMWLAVVFHSSLLLLSRDNKSAEEILCLNNAVQYQQSDGVSTCIISSVLFTYSMLAGSNAWMLQTIVLYRQFFPRSVIISFLDKLVTGVLTDYAKNKVIPGSCLGHSRNRPCLSSGSGNGNVYQSSAVTIAAEHHPYPYWWRH
jgi:hypothetical protein